MEVRAAIAQSDDRQCVTHEFLAIKGAQDLPASKQRHHEHRGRFDLQVLFAPDLALEGHAAIKFFQRLTTPDSDLPGHGFDAAPLARGFFAPSFSARFAWSHSASISVRGTSASARPEARATRSISRNRETNLALLRFNAISGSTLRKRARLTAPNSTSPSSSSTCCGDWAD